MKPERTFVAARALAQHCPELLARGGEAGSADPLAELARVGAVLARDLGAVFGPLLGAESLTFTPAAPVACDPATLADRIAPLAANTLLAIGGDGATVLVSIDAATVFRIVDRTFGGPGEAPAPLPEAFVPSAAMMAQRLSAALARALAKALGMEDGAVRPLRSEGRLAALEPFAPATALAILTLTTEQAGQAPWAIHFAARPDMLASVSSAKPRPMHPAASPGPDEQPWSGLPLTLTAVLVDMRLPVSALAGLRPDAILPVPVARQVPLRIGRRTLAHGTVGTLEDRVALQITQPF